MVWWSSAALLIVVTASFVLLIRKAPSPGPRTLTRLTFDEGLQFGVTWSPDSRFIAYSSDRGGKFDIWMRQISGGDPIQITKGPGDNWAPTWSPDGKYIAYRSENGDGGLFIVPALGGAGLERKIASFGHYPRWSPDGSQILFQTTEYTGLPQNKFYVVNLDGSAPREIATEFIKDDIAGLSAVWHPDGKRISVWTCGPSAFEFWTQPIAGGPAVKTAISSEVSRQMEEMGQGRGTAEWRLDFAFAWDPSGKAIYLERTFRGAKNIWRMSVDPQTLRALAFERLTTGSGNDSDLALSLDGKKLAFTAERKEVRGWLFPFEANGGRLLGPGRPVTAPGVDAWELSLSRDGKNLAYRGSRAGKWELWETSLSDGQGAPIAQDSYLRNFPQWSADGKHLAYFRDNLSSQDRQLVDWSATTREERPLSPPARLELLPYDWSPNGKQLLATRIDPKTGLAEAWLLPVSGDERPETAGRRLISRSPYNVYQSHFSPDGRWIVFVGIKPLGLRSAIYVVPAAGTPWIPITDGRHWDDKPHWSPDGKTIYFISSRSGFYDVFGVHFDPARPEHRSTPFPVTTFRSPRLMIPKQISAVELGVSRDKLVLTLEENSGSIWMLDNVGP